jgi:hypothetical protein
MNPNLYVLSGGKVLNVNEVRSIAKNGTSNLTVTFPDGSAEVYSDPGNTVYNKIVAASN